MVTYYLLRSRSEIKQNVIANRHEFRSCWDSTGAAHWLKWRWFTGGTVVRILPQWPNCWGWMGRAGRRHMPCKHSQMNPLLSISTVMVYSFYFCPCLGQKAHCCVPSSGFPSLRPLIHQSILHTAAWMSSIQFNSSSHIFLFKILQLLPIAFRTKPKLLSLTSKAFMCSSYKYPSYKLWCAKM